MTVRPYSLMTFAEIRRILNRRAQGEQELMEEIEEVDAASLYYHTHSFYLRAKYRHERYPNDFAIWVEENVRDRVLSERLAMVDPYTLQNIESIRRKFVALIEDHLQSIGFSPRALFGDPFEFIVDHVIPLPTGVEVRTRAELRDALHAALPETLYYHFFEDAFRRGRHIGTLVEWVADDLRDARLAEELSRINPYRLHLEQLRTDLLKAFDRAGGEA